MPPHPGPYDFVAYAYLFKNLQFPEVFLDNEPLHFGTAGTAVKSFGFLNDKDKLKSSVFGQVKIHDYQGPDDVVISLKTDDPQDQLILAKVTPGDTLTGTIAAVLARVKTGQDGLRAETRRPLHPQAQLRPREEFQGPREPHAQARPQHAGEKSRHHRGQAARPLQLNEKGAVLKSEAAIVMMGAALAMPAEQHELIFDKPFLILMKQANATEPYFAMWVGNTSLLIPAK